MTVKEATVFLSATDIGNAKPSAWADLGCGNGLFSQVLSSRLHAGSTVHATDKVNPPPILSLKPDVDIIFRQADFVKDDLPLRNIDGILLANALHYVEDKAALIRKLTQYLQTDGCFVIIEYDNAKANRWVPYPVSFTQLKELFAKEGYRYIERTGERTSIYQPGKMYVCSVTL